MNTKSFDLLTSKWCNLTTSAIVVIVTDSESLTVANEIKNDIVNECKIILFCKNESILPTLAELSPSDLVIALFTFNTFVLGGANRTFSPFSKPQGVKSKYAFFRLSITKESLLQGLSTPKELVYGKICEMQKIKNDSTLRVTNISGTDITLRIKPFTTCSHEITCNGGMAFLPPSETSSEILPNTANGKIVVDVTVGQLYHYGEFLGYYGIVPTPITLVVENGAITNIYGNDMANDLKEKLFNIPPECRELVELGQGLSMMAPTGLIGVDESIIDTCHFGIGDGGKCGVHLDVVISKPNIRENKEIDDSAAVVV